MWSCWQSQRSILTFSSTDATKHAPLCLLWPTARKLHLLYYMYVVGLRVQYGWNEHQCIMFHPTVSKAKHEPALNAHIWLLSYPPLAASYFFHHRSSRTLCSLNTMDHSDAAALSDSLLGRFSSVALVCTVRVMEDFRIREAAGYSLSDFASLREKSKPVCFMLSDTNQCCPVNIS